MHQVFENKILHIIRKLMHIPERVPRFVQIDFTTICNINCSMCPRKSLNLEYTHLEMDIFKKIVDRLNGAKTITLVGYGEPLTHPELFEAIRYCKDKGFKTQITTNGLLLDTGEKIINLIKTGLDSISVSMETLKGIHSEGHANEKTVKNVEHLLEIKKKIGAKNPDVTIQPVLFSNNIQNIYEIIEWCAWQGIKRVNIPRVDILFNRNLKRPTVAEEKEIFKEFAKLRNKCRIRVDYVQDQIFDGILGFLYKHFKWLLRLDHYCYKFQDFSFIRKDGSVYPCCSSLPEMKMGNIFESSLEEIFHNEKYNYLRHNMDKFTLCLRCDSFRLIQIQDS